MGESFERCDLLSLESAMKFEPKWVGWPHRIFEPTTSHVFSRVYPG